MIGTLLDQRYQVVRVLGEGGFGHTYIAQDTRRPGNPTCVVKHLKPATSDPDFLQTARRLFNSEAETLEKLGAHDQIPRLLAYFEENEEFYLVEEYVPGHPLSAELQPGQRWSESHVLNLLQEVLPILEFVHSQGVIHRDIKPDNLIRREQDNKLVLVDFGAVKQVKMQSIIAQEPVNETVAIGTPGYMPSEQGQGRPRPSSDIYALGMVGIQALTGCNPRQLSEDPATGEIIWREYAQVSDGLATILTKMARHYFKYRYQSATEVLQSLQQLTNPSTPSALVIVTGQKVGSYFRNSYLSTARALRLLQYQFATKALQVIEPMTKPHIPPDGATTPGATPPLGVPTSPSTHSGQNTITIAPANPYVSSVGSPYGQGSVPQSSNKLPLILGTGIAVAGIAIAFYMTRKPEPSPNANRTKTEVTANQPKPEPKPTCVVGRSSNIRSAPGGGRTGQVAKAGSKITITGQEKNGWAEISAPEAGWIYKSRARITCPPS
ncbi:MAG: serine/threonine protein kinase [Coleofasciculus sp. S288]|nr:serine/threonine protein kinase [Coleofasciculus sp. S288]